MCVVLLVYQTIRRNSCQKIACLEVYNRYNRENNRCVFSAAVPVLLGLFLFM